MKKYIVMIVLTAILLGGCGSQKLNDATGQDIAPGPSEKAVSTETETSEDTLYTINKFIGVFVEQRFEAYDRADAQKGQILEFLHSYIKCRAAGELEYKPLGAGGTIYETISLDAMNRRANEFFGIRFEEDEVKDYIVTRYDGDVISSMYYKGDFYFTATEGEARNRIAVADSVTGSKDGSLTVEFTIFELDYKIYAEYGSVPDGYYCLNSEAARQKDELTARGKGTAVISGFSGASESGPVLECIKTDYNY